MKWAIKRRGATAPTLLKRWVAAATWGSLSAPFPWAAGIVWLRLLPGRLLAVAFGVLLPLLGLEIGFRAMGPFLPGFYDLGPDREFDPVLGSRHRANFVGAVRTPEYVNRFSINERGLRDENIAYEKPAGAFRVLALGDSFLSALQVPLEQTMPKQLQGLLQAQTAPRHAEVINAGVSTYGTAEEFLYLDTEGFKYSPDLVILVVYVGNDLFDNVLEGEVGPDRPGRRPRFTLDHGGRLTQVEWPEQGWRRHPWDEQLLHNSVAYGFIQSGIFSKLDQADNRTRPADQSLGKLALYELNQSDSLRHSWEVMEALLSAIGRRSQQLGGRLIVVGAPTYEQLQVDRFAGLLRRQGANPAEYDSELPGRQLRDAAARQNLPYLDLLPALRHAIADGRRVYYAKDMHWTHEGHDVAARAIYDYLMSHGFMR